MKDCDYISESILKNIHKYKPGTKIKPVAELTGKKFDEECVISEPFEYTFDENGRNMYVNVDKFYYLSAFNDSFYRHNKVKRLIYRRGYNNSGETWATILE